eukprot:TRINITY_DN8864_c0_g1_i2.p1 TRINITY_DN8864_c0_g1~~TRINITY_DN8864_c0_g1_i2.p1  ORF type:complete len:476 (+),score=113.90 TRINITY_DN8864_c0_g1_i2:54-1430(+)
MAELSRFDADLFTRNLHYTGAFWEEHRDNMRALIEKMMNTENIIKLYLNAARLCLTFNEQAKWISQQYNREILFHALETLRLKIAEDKVFLWKVMSAYFDLFVEKLDSIPNKTANRLPKDLPNSPELKQIVAFFQDNKGDFSKNERLIEIGKLILADKFELESFISCFLPPMMLLFLRFFDIYDTALQGHLVEDYLQKLDHARKNPRPAQPTNEEEAIKKVLGEKMLKSFGQKTFWETRYKDIKADFKPYDWYASWDSIRVKVMEKTGLDKLKKARVLYTGVGDSLLAEDLIYDEALDIADVTGVDWVEGMIAAQQERVRLQDLNSRLHYACVDITQKSLETAAYDLVIEKALIDSLISHPDAKDLLPKALRNISQSMKEGAHFVCVSSAVGIERVALFDRKDCNWKTLHLSELAADKDPETKINLIIVRKYTQDELKALAEQNATPTTATASSSSSS